MRRLGWSALALFLIGAAAAAGVLAITGDDGGDHDAYVPTTASAPTAPGDRPAPTPVRSARSRDRDTIRHQVRKAVGQSTAARLDPGQRRMARTVRSYFAALDRHDGAGACRLFARGALSGVSFPRKRGGCGATLSASIGFRHPRGFPVFAGVRVARIPAVAIDGSNRARVTATTVTRFADGREPSVEDDLLYLRKRHGRWLIAKPGAALYRAIGVGEIPPAALSPP